MSTKQDDLKTSRAGEHKEKRQTRAERKAALRQKMDGNNAKLYIEDALKRPDKRYFWALDKPGRIKKLLDLGYEFVLSADGSKVCEFGSSGEKDTQMQYLLAIDREIHQMLVEIKQEKKAQKRKELGTGENLYSDNPVTFHNK